MNDGDYRLPPKKRNWTPGSYQLGFFVRMPDGSTITTICDRVSNEDAKTVISVMAEVAVNRGRLEHVTSTGKTRA